MSPSAPTRSPSSMIATLWLERWRRTVSGSAGKKASIAFPVNGYSETAIDAYLQEHTPPSLASAYAFPSTAAS